MTAVPKTSKLLWIIPETSRNGENSTSKDRLLMGSFPTQKTCQLSESDESDESWSPRSPTISQGTGQIAYDPSRHGAEDLEAQHGWDGLEKSPLVNV